MSFQSEKDKALEAETLQSMPLNLGFEKHIIQCCKQPEWILRAFIKKICTRQGFTIIEDGYRSDRCNKDKRYESVHNMLCIRGNPKTCLVAHTDICRDHDAVRFHRDDYGKYGDLHHWMDDQDSTSTPIQVEPVIKSIVDDGGNMRRIIQDKTCKLQVGGDDRLGVAINTNIAWNTGYDIALLFVTDEEIGLRSSSACQFEELKKFNLVVQTDRGNHSNELVVKIGGEILADYDAIVRALDCAWRIGYPRNIVNGGSTDVRALHSANKIGNCFNMTVGYHNSQGSNPTEYIDVQEAIEAMQFVAEMVKDQEINGE